MLRRLREPGRARPVVTRDISARGLGIWWGGVDLFFAGEVTRGARADREQTLEVRFPSLFGRRWVPGRPVLHAGRGSVGLDLSSAVSPPSRS